MSTKVIWTAVIEDWLHLIMSNGEVNFFIQLLGVLHLTFLYEPFFSLILSGQGSNWWVQDTQL